MVIRYVWDIIESSRFKEARRYSYRRAVRFAQDVK